MNENMYMFPRRRLVLVLGQFVQTRSDHKARERYGVETRVQPCH